MGGNNNSKLFNLDRMITTTNDTVWGEQLKKRILSLWSQMLVDNGVILILSGSHGRPDGTLKREEMLTDEDGTQYLHNAQEFVDEDRIKAKEIENEKAADFAKFNMKIVILDIWQSVNSAGDDIYFKKLGEEIKKIGPTSIVAGWCHSKSAEVFLERLGVTANLVLQDDLMKVLGKR